MKHKKLDVFQATALIRLNEVWRQIDMMELYTSYDDTIFQDIWRMEEIIDGKC